MEDEMDNIEIDMIELSKIEETQEQIEEAKAEHKELIQERKKHEYLTVGESCPICNKYPLEEQVFGYEKSIFCTNCHYQRMESM